MKRRVFNVMVVISLALFVGAILLPGVYSHFRLPLLFPDSHFWPMELILGRNGLQVFHDWGPPHPSLYVSIDEWFAMWATGILPAWWVLNHLRDAVIKMLPLTHSRRGCCANCGYDLRATPDRCPECGRDVVVSKV